MRLLVLTTPRPRRQPVLLLKAARESASLFDARAEARRGFDEAKHPREPKGQRTERYRGGEFVPKDTTETTPTPPPAAEPAPSPEEKGRATRADDARADEARALLARRGVDPSAKTPRGIVEILTRQIRVDPHRFQFKANVNALTGAGEELQTVGKWDPDLAGILLVWMDPANNKTYVVNGHHRLDLARRMKISRLPVRYIEAPSAERAMVKGAIANIAEGRGTPIDAAKLFRTTRIGTRELERAGVSITGNLARQALGLANLAPSLWKIIVAEDLPIERGATIGQHFATATEQEALLALLKRTEIRGKRLTNPEIAELARFVKSAGRRKETVATLFGEEAIEKSLAVEKAQLSAWIKLRLLYDKRMFSYVSGKDVAEGLKRGDTHVNVERSRELAAHTRQLEAVWDALVDKTGPVNSALNRAAKRLAAKENLTAIRNDLYREAEGAMRQELATMGIGAQSTIGEAHAA